jgi:hypothetical protein
MKIAMLNCFNNEYDEIFQITKKSKINYCKKNGIDFLTYNFQLKDRTQHWGRVLGIKEHLKNYDYILYLDTDTLILNYDLDIRKIIIDNDFNIISGPLPHEGHIGTNGLILKNNKWTYEFLDNWYSQEKFIKSPYYGSPSCGTGDDGGFNAPPNEWIFYEQSAFHYLYDTIESIRKNIHLIERKYFHAVPKTFKKGDFLIHVPGMKKEIKIKLLKKYHIDNLKKFL